MTLTLTLPTERRKQDRRPEAGVARCAILSQSAPSRVAMIALRDTSPAGLGIVSPVSAMPGDMVQLFPFYQPIATVHAEVVRCDGLGDGTFSIGLKRRVLASISRPRRRVSA